MYRLSELCTAEVRRIPWQVLRRRHGADRRLDRQQAATAMRLESLAQGKRQRLWRCRPEWGSRVPLDVGRVVAARRRSELADTHGLILELAPN
jgi:hypothetical protein